MLSILTGLNSKVFGYFRNLSKWGKEEAVEEVSGTEILVSGSSTCRPCAQNIKEHGKLECCGSRVLKSSSSMDQEANPFIADFQKIVREIGRGDTSLLPILAPYPLKKRSAVCRCWAGQKNKSVFLASE